MVSDASDNKEAFDDCADGFGSEQSVPDVAVRWVVHNTFTNTELAALSNVSRVWREIVAQCVVDTACSESDKRRPLAQSPPSTFTCLILPSLIRHYYSLHSNFPLTQPGQEKKRKEDENHDTYCVAWFHPDGIRFKQLTRQNPSPEICTGGEQEYEIAHINLKTTTTRIPSNNEVIVTPSVDNKSVFATNKSRLHQASTAVSPLPISSTARDNILSLGASVLFQWDGYSEAIDVLSPFGYSNFLLRRVVEKTRGKLIGHSSDSKPASSGISYHRNSVGESIPLPSSSPWVFPARCDNIYSTVAVRGAICARPEGYCQCWDKHDADMLAHQNETRNIKGSLRKGELERLVLPKVLRGKHGDGDSIETGEIVRPFIQFLNIDSSNAIRLVTPKFEHPIFTPLTVFCVAIATEDGCFFSGLQEKLEMGHMYPTPFNEEINDERSPICLNAEYTERGICLSQDEFEQAATGNGCRHNNPDHVKDACARSDCDCFYTLNSSDGDSKFLNDDSDAEGSSNAIRGQLGPGTWHCYVAIFDGNQSIIRIDGEDESTTHASTIPSSFQACLDGITIGSDHSFDMSLCFGQGSDGEGEGAISELAFFRGRLHTKDIASLESHLMTKHGIPLPMKPRKEILNDDYLSRLAHKLMDESPTSAERNEDKDTPVPLRYMTELRQVAWQQRDKVTGRCLSVKRIGNRSRNGSTSEW